MIIGTVKEILNHEYRVGITPAATAAYVKKGHQVVVQKTAGMGAAFTDDEYIQAGAKIVDTAKEVYENSQMVIKVKQPLEEEFKYLRKDLILYTYLHLAAHKDLTEALLESQTTAIAFETIEDKQGGFPCLRPMSEIAGRLSIQEGAKFLERPCGGRGILLSGAVGVDRGKIVIIGGGIAGTYAAKVAIGIGAQVTILDISVNRLSYLEDLFGSAVETLYSDEDNIIKNIKEAVLVVGAVLVPGATPPKVLRREHLKYMKQGAVIVDIAIDQGGCFETSHVTTHDDPTYTVDGIVHYCVGNMPGAVPRTSTIALSNATLPYGLKIATLGVEQAIKQDTFLAKGLNTYKGKCVYENVGKSLGIEYNSLSEVFR